MMNSTTLNKKKVAFYTLGCKLNFSETSTIARDFTQKGYERVDFEDEADIYFGGAQLPQLRCPHRNGRGKTAGGNGSLSQSDETDADAASGADAIRLLRRAGVCPCGAGVYAPHRGKRR